MEDLSYIILPHKHTEINQRVGHEKKVKKGDFQFMENDNSVRVLYSKNNEVVAGLHFIKLGDRRIIAGIHTEENYRRQGIMTKVMKVAEKRYGQLEHSQHKTEIGNYFVDNFENNRKLNKSVSSLKEKYKKEEKQPLKHKI